MEGKRKLRKGTGEGRGDSKQEEYEREECKEQRKTTMRRRKEWKTKEEAGDRLKKGNQEDTANKTKTKEKDVKKNGGEHHTIHTIVPSPPPSLASSVTSNGKLLCASLIDASIRGPIQRLLSQAPSRSGVRKRGKEGEVSRIRMEGRTV